MISYADNIISRNRNIIENRKTSHNNESDSDQESEGDEEIKKNIMDKLEAKKRVKTDSRRSRQGISAEVFGKYNEKKPFQPKIIEKDEGARKQIITLINNSILFHGLNDGDKEVIVQAMTEVKTNSDELVIKEGDEGSILYIISTG